MKAIEALLALILTTLKTKDTSIGKEKQKNKNKIKNKNIIIL